MGGYITGLDGLEFDKGSVSPAVGHEHEVNSPEEMGAAAVDAGLVGVVDDDDGGEAFVSKGAEGTEDGAKVEDGVLVDAGDDTCKGIDDDEGGAGLVSGLRNDVDVLGAAEIETSEGGEMEGEVGGSVMGAHDLGKAGEEAELTALFVNPEDASLFGGAVEPGHAEGNADGEVEEGVGLFGTGHTDDEVEAGMGDEVGDEVFGGLAGVEGDGSGDEAFFGVGIKSRGKPFPDIWFEGVFYL